jgi:23S rRNA (cytidine1920-2'-O)/16S rRNA (cytidine1409-2'-O)-methyltransferase
MRLDGELARRGLARSRSHGRQLIDTGRVRLDENPSPKPSTQVTDLTVITVDTDHYVSRAAHKLIHALDESGIQIAGRVLDVGASTGGFTQVLLERGASQVYAIDVGHGQMAQEIRENPRVVVREGVNARYLTIDDVGNAKVDQVVADVSFISATMVLPAICQVVRPLGQILVLVKPQFEVGRLALDSRGVVTDDQCRAGAVQEVIECGEKLGCSLVWRGDCVVRGEQGNQETFCLFVVPGD